MAGGSDGSSLDTVEMINLETMSSCIVDVKLDKPKYYHTGDGNLVCGGEDGTNPSSCFNIVTRTSTKLLQFRSEHTSWSTNDGLYLLGGIHSAGSTTELITGDTTQAGFTLKHATT